MLLSLFLQPFFSGLTFCLCVFKKKKVGREGERQKEKKEERKKKLQKSEDFDQIGL